MRIAEVARVVGVSPGTIRKWERQQLVRPPRGANGYRYFTSREIQRLALIKRMTLQGMSLVAIRHALPPTPAEVGTAPSRLPGILRLLRTEAGLSVQELSQAIGVSGVELVLLEGGRATGSVATLQRLATLYGVALIDLVKGDVAPQAQFMPAQERPQLALPDEDVTIEGLAQGPVGLQPTLLTVAPGGGAEESHAHPGEEFLYVLSGRLEIWLGDTRYLLEPGDSLAFLSLTPHRWRAIAPTATMILWVHREDHQDQPGKDTLPALAWRLGKGVDA